MRVNGLYGHVRSNDVRSLALFAGFVAAFHLLAVLALVVPLAMLDPDHAPLYGWTGYLVRWVPIVTIIGALLFAHADGVARPHRSPQDGFPLRRRSRRAAALPYRRAAGNRRRPADPVCRRHRQSGAQRIRLRHPAEGRRARLHARADRWAGRRRTGGRRSARNRPHRERRHPPDRGHQCLPRHAETAAAAAQHAAREPDLGGLHASDPGRCCCPSWSCSSSSRCSCAGSPSTAATSRGC